MNILYIGTFRLPNYDAAAARVLNNAKVFREVGHEVSFLGWDGKYRNGDLCEDGKYRVDGFEYFITNELISKGSLLNRMLSKRHRGNKTLALLNQMKLPDLIVLYNASNGWTKKMIKFCQEHNIKLANDITEWYDNNELRITDIWSNHINMTKTQGLVKNKIVISSFLNGFYKDSNNLLLPPLCDSQAEKWKLTVDDDRVQPFDGITLIYAGNPAKKDCVHTVINAVNTLANEGEKIRFIILGTTRDNYIVNYRDKLAIGRLHENIIFLGRVSQDLIPAYYKKADFMVLLREPTRKNMAGFPTKFAESMTAGVPVIANATSDITKFLRNGENGFIVEGYGYNQILKTLRTRVLTLNRGTVNDMKVRTSKINSSFDFRNYHNSVQIFIDNIK